MWLADILGLDATPATFRPSQCLLGAIRLPQAPKPIASTHFWESLLVSRLRYASRRLALTSRVPSVGLSRSLAFYSLTPCEVGDVLWSARYP
jgi:hypothetical protein